MYICMKGHMGEILQPLDIYRYIFNHFHGMVLGLNESSTTNSKENEFLGCC